MIQEHHEDIPEGYRVSAPVVLPWAEYPECPKCAHGLKPLFLRWWMVARGKQAQELAYCRGDLNSTMRVPAMNLAEMQFAMVEQKIPCFGVFDEHFHVTCGRCSYRWLMQCRAEASHVEHNTGSGA